jgi:hypothetical protein
MKRMFADTYHTCANEVSYRRRIYCNIHTHLFQRR